MTYPPQPPYGQPGFGGQGQPPPGSGSQQPGGPYGAPGGPSGQPAESGWGQPQPGPGGWPSGQQPYGTPAAGFGQPGGYGPPSGRKSPLLWLLIGGGAVVVLAVALVLVFTLSGDGGGTASPRAVAQAFVTSVNNDQPNESIFCPEAIGDAADVIPEVPDLPELTTKATLGDVQETGDTATALVNFEISAGGETLSGSWKLDITKQDNEWKICKIETENIDLPGLGG